MVELAIGNSRMKDFFDLWVLVLGHQFAFDGALIARAIQATFDRRRTALPTQEPLALTSRFSSDSTKQTQWKAFINRTQPRSPFMPPALDEICTFLNGFLMPPLLSLARGRSFNAQWNPGGPWVQR
jgi:hypothetical protein